MLTQDWRIVDDVAVQRHTLATYGIIVGCGVVLAGIALSGTLSTSAL